MSDMSIKDAIKLQRHLFERRMDLRYRKGMDYSNPDNAHDNFETVADIAKLLKIDITTPWGVAQLHRIHKLQRECNLLYGSKEPQNESLLDTLLDSNNYTDLELEMLVKYGVIKLETEE